jgi:hypothetical protein
MEIISKINATRKTLNSSRENQDQENFEWKVDISSRDSLVHKLGKDQNDRLFYIA